MTLSTASVSANLGSSLLGFRSSSKALFVCIHLSIHESAALVSAYRWSIIVFIAVVFVNTMTIVLTIIVLVAVVATGIAIVIVIAIAIVL